ncbi:MAG: hypothetical protein ABIJ85_01460 [bacterium]
MLKQLKKQIEDIHAGSTSDLSDEYGHAVGIIAQVGQDEAHCGGDKEAQINRMRQKAEEEVIKYGPKILNYLRPDLRALIQPEDMVGLEEEHQMYLSNRERNRK